MVFLTAQICVIDNGTGSIKAGLAGKAKPDAIIPTVLGRKKYPETVLAADDVKECLGQEARNKRGLLTLRYPMKAGRIVNWSDMEKVWHHTYSALGLRASDHPVLITEAPFNPVKDRELLVKHFLEGLSVPAIYVSHGATLSLLGAGRSTGLAVDVGEGVSHSVVMVEGNAVPYAVSRSDIGGTDVSKLLGSLLNRSGYVFSTSAEFDLIREIKEKSCSASRRTFKAFTDIHSEMSRATASGRGQGQAFTLPDNTVLELGLERNWAPECLFHPILVGKEDLGVHEAGMVSVERAPIDYRAELYGGVVLSGGSTLIPGFGERMVAEFTRQVPKKTRIAIRASSNREFGVYAGASVLASLQSFRKHMITKEEYEEMGDAAIHRKAR